MFCWHHLEIRKTVKKIVWVELAIYWYLTWKQTLQLKIFWEFDFSRIQSIKNQLSTRESVRQVLKSWDSSRESWQVCFYFLLAFSRRRLEAVNGVNLTWDRYQWNMSLFHHLHFLEWLLCLETPQPVAVSTRFPRMTANYTGLKILYLLKSYHYWSFPF